MIVDWLQQASLSFRSHSQSKVLQWPHASENHGEHKLQGITVKRRISKNGYTTPYEIYGPHEVIRTLTDPGHLEKKCWITMYNKKFLLPMDYGAR